MFPYVLNHRNGWIIPLALSLSSPSSVDAEESPPVNYGMIIFPAFQAIDVFGPLDILTILSWTQTLNLSVISTSLDPVNTKPLSMNISSNFGESIVPTHTFDQPPEDLEVLFVPGGLGTRSDEVVAPAVEFVKSVYPKLKYLVSVCTGATILAKAGVLDGKNATTNKHSWDWVNYANFSTLSNRLEVIGHTNLSKGYFHRTIYVLECSCTLGNRWQYMDGLRYYSGDGYYVRIHLGDIR